VDEYIYYINVQNYINDNDTAPPKLGQNI